MMRKTGMLLLLAGIFTVAVVSAGTVSAQDDATTTDSNRQARIEEYKQRVTDRLSDVQSERIAARCSAAQAKITQLQTNITSVIQRRTIVYNNLQEKLNTVSDSVSEAGVDTTELQALIEQMSNKVSVVLSTAESYQSILDDLAAMDCTADPDGFQATLQVAREERARLIETAQDLKDFVSSDVKAEIQLLRESIANPPASTDQATEEGVTP